MKKMNKKGFTIVELVIVIAVIAILAAVLIPTFSGVIEKAQESNAKQVAIANFKDAYALDWSDGELNGKEDGADIATTGTYSVSGDPAKASYTETVDGYTVSTNDSGETWTVTKS